MINFFRKTRKNLADKNKPMKYLRYAIGEIVLVMIGILLALQVNNWNELRKDRIVEQQVLTELKEEYETNAKQLEGKILLRNLIIKSSIEVLGYIDNPKKINKDSLIKKIAVIRFDPTFDPIENDLISSGNIRLIQNNKLRKLLSNWSSEIASVQEMELQWQKIRSETAIPYLLNLGIYRDVIDLNFDDNISKAWALDGLVINKLTVGKSKKSPSVEQMLNYKGLESIMSLALNQSNVINNQSVTLLNRINEILELINTEIDND